MKLLIADDDASTRAALKIILTSKGYDLCWASDGVQTLEVFKSQKPDIVILDVMMPDLNGFEVCERIREISSSTPILFLSAKGETEDRKCGLRIGADDYMAKPFDAEELELRIQALARRVRMPKPLATLSSASAAEDSLVLKVGPIEIDRRRHEVSVGTKKIPVTPNEFRLLSLLAEHAGEVVSQKELTEGLWGDSYVGERASIAVYVRHLREKMEADPSKPLFLQTVWGVGYRLIDGSGQF